MFTTYNFSSSLANALSLSPSLGRLRSLPAETTRAGQ